MNTVIKAKQITHDIYIHMIRSTVCMKIEMKLVRGRKHCLDGFSSV